jgi:undecaprenyl-diphosphatase
MEIMWAIILGLVQGVTEFFPISSSAHLSLFPYIFDFKDPGLTHNIALHAGSLLAIFVALRADWIALIKGAIKKGMNFEKKFIFFLVLTTIPGAFVGYFFEEQAATVFRNPLLSAFNLVFFGVLLVVFDRYTKRKQDVETMGPQKAIGVGLAQALAIIPGISRSGATITAGRALGLSREAAVKYSFMAALPIITGATVFGLRDISFNTLASPVWSLGLVASFASSLWAIRFLTKFVKKHSFEVFMYYRFGLAALVVFLYLVRL